MAVPRGKSARALGYVRDARGRWRDTSGRYVASTRVERAVRASAAWAARRSSATSAAPTSAAPTSAAVERARALGYVRDARGRWRDTSGRYVASTRVERAMRTSAPSTSATSATSQPKTAVIEKNVAEVEKKLVGRPGSDVQVVSETGLVEVPGAPLASRYRVADWPETPLVSDSRGRVVPDPDYMVWLSELGDIDVSDLYDLYYYGEM